MQAIVTVKYSYEVNCILTELSNSRMMIKNQMMSTYVTSLDKELMLTGT